MASAMELARIRFKTRPFPHKGRAPSSMCGFFRREGIRFGLPLVIVNPFSVAAAKPAVLLRAILRGRRYSCREVQWWPGGRPCMQAVQSLASDHFRLLGVRGASDPPLLFASKSNNWNTRLEVPGWLMDTVMLTVKLPPHKRLQLRSLLA